MDPETRSVLLNHLGGFQRKAGLLDDAEKSFREWKSMPPPLATGPMRIGRGAGCA
ncbi:MAG: hypothetical protein KA175_15310 [Flavobacteriales bacterium]|nr:hypothetical protein [Flavobacteriales bacterium]MBP6391119.1 hypothetical protein [Flavobacteriales bacterium]MBP6698988.1 hypothetical protein [Flavobacteriales bacterium]